MEEEEEHEDKMFWQQNRGGHPLRRSYSLFLTTGTLFIFLVAFAIAFTIIILPTLHSLASHIFKPNSVKKSWDSLNLVLVLFAIFCGFLSRNNNETSREEDEVQSFSNTPQEYVEPSSATTWYEYSDRTPYYRLRSFNSYPDLRIVDDERWRFYDDTHVNVYRRQRPEEEEEEKSIENRGMNDFEELVLSALPLPAERKTGTSKNVDGYRRSKPETGEEKQSIKDRKVKSFEKVVPSAPPLPESLPISPAETSSGKSKSKRGSETREFLTSLKGKKKKQRNRSVEDFNNIRISEPPTLPPKRPPPPPPPPPMSTSSVFHNLFSSKKSKQKKHNSDSQNRVSKTELIHRGVIANANATFKPMKREDFNPLEENVTAGNESPSIPIPPPPPLPPFKIPAWTFRRQGDFVRIDTISSSSSISPDIDEASTYNKDDDDYDEEEEEEDPRKPSIDIDTKADTFIKNFRADLRLERINSSKEKQGFLRSTLQIKHDYMKLDQS